MIVEFMSNYNSYGIWRCIATKNLTVVPSCGTTVRIKEEGHPHMTYKVKKVELDVDFPKYIVYLS